MSSSPSKTPSQESSSSDSDESLYENSDDEQVSSSTQTPDQISTHPENILKNQSTDSRLDQEQQTILDQPIDSLIQANQPIISQSLGDEVSTEALSQPSNVVKRPQKPSAFVIKNLMSRLPPRKPPGTPRMPAPHLQKIQSQEEGTSTGISRNVESPQEERISAGSKKVILKGFKRKFDFPEDKRKKLKLPVFDQGEESRFLFPLSESEGEDDFATLKFLSTYVSNGGNLAPNFANVVVDFINGIVAENCRIQFSQFRRKVVALRSKFLLLVEQNGGENFRRADFSTARDYEMAQLCKIVWTDRQESKRSGSCVDLNSDPKLNVDPTSDEVKSADGIVRELEEMSLGDAGVIVDPGDESVDTGVNVDHGNAAGLGMNVDHGNEAGPGMNVDCSNVAGPGMNVDRGNAAGRAVNVDHGNAADPGMNVDQGTEARADPGVTMDQTDGADPGTRADQKKDSEMGIDRNAVGLFNTDTTQEPNARDGTDPPIKLKVYSRKKKIAKK